MSSIFGGTKSSSSSTSTSGNSNNSLLTSQYSDLLGTTNTASDYLGALLSGDSSGLDAYKDATGYASTLENGDNNISNNMAAAGLRTSGDAAKALAAYGSNLDSTYANNYLNALSTYGQTGLSAANLLASSGQYSNSSSQSKSTTSQGISGLAGAALSAYAGNPTAFSDRRLKTNIKKIGKMSNGLNLYEYSYSWSPNETETGVMAQEVAKVKPEALGPIVSGYMTVDYSKLLEA